MFDLLPWQWALVILGAFLAGVSKTGIAGLGILTVAIYANVLPARESTGIILPMLIAADVIAVAAYRRHAVWVHLWRLFPWIGVGVILGWWWMDRISGAQVRVVIGVILLAMTGLHLWRKWRQAETIPHTWWAAAGAGILAGITTMMANAAGPVMVLYWLALGLPKLEFMGTGAWFFLIVNTFKVPFSWQLGLITPASLQFNLWMLPAIVAGAWLGKAYIHRVNQTWFERIALALTLAAAVRLVL